MQTSPITSAIQTQSSSVKDNSPEFLFVCEKELTIPYITYQIQDNHIYLTMQCNSLNPHIQTISYDEYKNRNSNSNVKSKAKRKWTHRPTKDSLGYCNQHEHPLSIGCKKGYLNDFPNDSNLPKNVNNLNSNCKEHPNSAMILYCKQCNLSICSECASNKHKNHPTLNIKNQLTSQEIAKLKEDFKTYEVNYFQRIDSAYIQAQGELKKDYENNKSDNKELFDIVRNVMYMSDTLEESNDFNLLSNLTNVVDNMDIHNLFTYQPGHITELQSYWKSNLVLNIHNIKDIKDVNSINAPVLSNPPTDFTLINNTKMSNNKDNNNNRNTKATAALLQKKRSRNVNEFECVTTLTYECEVISLCKWNEDLYAVGVGNYTPYKIHIVEYSNSTIIRSLTGHRDTIWRWYWHKKTDNLLSLSNDSDIRIWNYSNGNCIAVIKGKNDCVGAIVELTSGDIIAVSSDRSIKYWHMDTFKCYKTIKNAHDSYITSVIMVNNNKHWITGGLDQVWKLWNVSANTKEDTINSIRTGSAIWSWLEVNDSKWLVGLESGDIWMYNINSFIQVGKLRQHTNYVTIMVLLSDGTIISGSLDSKVIVWDVNTISCIQTLEEHTWGIHTCLIEMRENEILSGSLDETVRKWIRK